MTQNQLAYQANLERERANRATEDENRRSHMRTEELKSIDTQSAQLQARAAKQRADTEKELLPYTKAEKVASTAQKGAAALSSAIGPIGTIYKVLHAH